MAAVLCLSGEPVSASATCVHSLRPSKILASNFLLRLLISIVKDSRIFFGTELDNGLSARFPPEETAVTVADNALTRTSELFTALFLVPIKKWSVANEEKKIRDRLQKLNSDMVKEATNDAIVAMETEESVSPDKLAQLIKEVVSKETAAL